MVLIDRFPRWAQRVYFKYIRPSIYKRYRYTNQIIRDNRVQKILEIGVWNGLQAEQMIKEAQKNGPVDYYGFDLFEKMTEEMFKKAVAKHPPRMAVVQRDLEKTHAHVRLFMGFTQETLPVVAKELPTMDLIFIDGDHSLEGVASDWKHVQRLIGKNTVVIFDDYWNRTTEGAKVTVDSIDRKKFNVEVLPITDRSRRPDGPITIQFAKVTLKTAVKAPKTAHKTVKKAHKAVKHTQKHHKRSR